MALTGQALQVLNNSKSNGINIYLKFASKQFPGQNE